MLQQLSQCQSQTAQYAFAWIPGITKLSNFMARTQGCNNHTDQTNKYMLYDPNRWELRLSSYLTIFACHFGKYIFIRLLFRVVPADDMSQ